MRSILRKLLTGMKEQKKDHRGMSLVEVICAVAIFSLVSATIGGVIVVSARTYRKGVSETTVQQEAQLAANNIGNIVKDACSVQYGESNGQIKQDGVTPVTEADGTTPKLQPAGTKGLSIITNEQMQYSITYDISSQVLLYEEIDIASASSTGTQIMAKNIADFSADTDDFKENRTIKLSMTVKDESTGRNIPMSYTMTSRNQVAENMTFVSTSDDPVIIFLESNLYMVPGETYKIPISVIGKLSQGLEGSATDANVGAVNTDYVEVTIPRDATAETSTVTVWTKDKKSDGHTPKATNSTTIYIRRVESIGVTHAVNRSKTVNGSYEEKGAEYTFYANVNGKNLAKSPGASWDAGYKKAQAVYWSYELTVGGATYTYTSDSTGINYSNQTGIEQYVKLKESKEDIDKPSLTVEIMQDMPSDFVLEVTATSKHALGVNKASSRYPDDTTVITGSDTITPRETRVDETLEITLEPNESGELELNMMGGMTSNVTFAYNDRSDLTTKAEYIASTDKVRITLGKDEKGAGDTYTFTIDVMVSGTKKSTITVHVSRIDKVGIEVVDNFADAEDSSTYDFKAKINVSGTQNDSTMQNAVKYLLHDRSVVSNTLATRITWELINNTAGSTLHADSVICLAGVGAGDNGTVLGNYTAKYQNYYQIADIKPARIEQKADGTWYLAQVPEIDILPLADTDTGLPANVELKVTMEALHPLGKVGTTSYNKTGIAYGTAEDSVSIKGDQRLSIPADIVIVEPGQGTDVSSQSDTEMVIPISENGSAVSRLEVKLSGNSSSGTRLSNYTQEDKTNPYLDSSTVSANNIRTWYLGLVIGTDEKGKNNTGLIDVTVNAYNASSRLIATMEFQLAVRRVNEVDVLVRDNRAISAVNKAGSTVTLEAYPTGYGTDGTEYFDIQKDEDANICRWEKEGHGKYQSPLTMKWTMLYNGQEKPLEQWTEYFQQGTVASATDDKNYCNTVQFKLVQALPNGAEIRATSLHTLGTVNGTKYNKSGKNYGEQYGSLRIGASIIAADGFQRADEYTFMSDIPSLRAKYLSDISYQSSQRSFYRYREVGGNWSQFYMMDDHSENIARVSGTQTARIFLPDKEYELDIVNVVYSESRKVIYWPQDESLLEPGKGWIEAGFSLDNSWNMAAMTEAEKNFEYEKIYLIPKTEIFFDKCDAQKLTVDGKVSSIGSETAPLTLKTGDTFATSLAPTAFNLMKTQYHFTAILEKKVNGQWVTISQDNMQNTEQWFLQTHCPSFSIYNIYNAEGTYRISTTVKDMEWKTVSGGLFNPQYNSLIQDTPLYNLSDGSGVMYVKFN